jgi:large subunit ribosomal protein L19
MQACMRTPPMRPVAARPSALSARTAMAPAKLSVARRATVASAAPAGVSCSLHTLMEKVDQQSMKSDLMEFRVGREITVGVQVIEGNKTRVQPYKGVIIAMHKNGLSSTVTVRKMVQGVGVERCFPLHSPLCTFEPVATAGTPKVGPPNPARNLARIACLPGALCGAAGARGVSTAHRVFCAAELARVASRPHRGSGAIGHHRHRILPTWPLRPPPHIHERRRRSRDAAARRTPAPSAGPPRGFIGVGGKSASRPGGGGSDRTLQ